jgi:hypothetical protein
MISFQVSAFSLLSQQSDGTRSLNPRAPLRSIREWRRFLENKIAERNGGAGKGKPTPQRETCGFSVCSVHIYGTAHPEFPTPQTLH